MNALTPPAPVRYLVVAEDGTVHAATAPDWWAALEEVGPEGWNRVQLTQDLAAFVNDCGLILPKYVRNPVGGALLHALGAHPIPYAGPIVFTGWDGRRTYEGDDVEVVSLTDLQAGVLTWLVRMIRAVVGGTSSDTFESSTVAAVLAAAEIVRHGDVPGITVTSL